MELDRWAYFLAFVISMTGPADLNLREIEQLESRLSEVTQWEKRLREVADDLGVSVKI